MEGMQKKNSHLWRWLQVKLEQNLRWEEGRTSPVLCSQMLTALSASGISGGGKKLPNSQDRPFLKEKLQNTEYVLELHLKKKKAQKQLSRKWQHNDLLWSNLCSFSKESNVWKVLERSTEGKEVADKSLALT